MTNPGRLPPDPACARGTAAKWPGPRTRLGRALTEIEANIDVPKDVEDRIVAAVLRRETATPSAWLAWVLLGFVALVMGTAVAIGLWWIT